MNFKALLSGFAALLVSTTMSSAVMAQATAQGEVAGWDIMKAKDGSCYMQATFEGDSKVRMGLEKGEGVLVVLDPTWKSITDGSKNTLNLDLDGNSWEAVGVGMKDGGVPGMRIAFDDPDFFVDMMKKRVLSVQKGGKDLTVISLDGTNKALTAVLDCQDGKKIKK